MSWVINRHVGRLMDRYTIPLPHPPWFAWIKPRQPRVSFTFTDNAYSILLRKLI
ncbi:hypothetical protein HanRHA438_Chr16g0775631 [Helianthus annuus]|nr:hypothetical protein HanRHA438_Chr16g0775631 [Helianthus annuus]